MGKAALIAITAFGLAGVYYSANTQRSMSGSAESQADHQYEELARNAALAGHGRAEQFLVENFEAMGGASSKTFRDTYEGIEFVTKLAWETTASLAGYDVEAGSDEAAILTVAYRNGEPAFHLKSKYKLDPDGGEARELPEAFEHVMACDKEFDMTSTADVMVDGSVAGDRNANIHSNQLVGSTGTGTFNGFVTSGGAVRLTGVTVEPNYNPTGADAVRENVEEVDIPELDVVAYIDAVDGDDNAPDFDEGGIEIEGDDDEVEWENDDDVGEGNVKITGNHTIDLADYFDISEDRDEPFVWHVPGNVDVTGNVTLKTGGTREAPFVLHVGKKMTVTSNLNLEGYVVLLAEEGFDLAANIDTGNPDPGDGPVQTHVALYTPKSLTMTANVDRLYGQVLTGGDIRFTANMDFHGTVVSGGNIDITSTGSFQYVPPSPELAEHWVEAVPVMKRTVHSEW